MIPYTKIDNKLSIYKENKLVIWGKPEGYAEELLRMMTANGICVEAFCSTTKDKNVNFALGGKDIPCILYEDMVTLCCTNDKVIIQLAASKKDEELMKRTLDEAGIDNYICCGEALTKFRRIKRRRLYGEQPWLKDGIVNRRWAFAQTTCEDVYKEMMWECGGDTYLQICMPCKTGDNTVNEFLKKHRIRCGNYWHWPANYAKDFFENFQNKLKMVTAVRDPIAQNLSNIMQCIGETSVFSDLYNLPLIFDDANLVGVQEYFEIFLQDCGYIEENNEYLNSVRSERVYKEAGYTLIQQFIPNFQESIMDIMKYPFDKERGFSIIRENNREVFVFQTERMDDVWEAFLQWAAPELKYEKCEKRNVGVEKWYAPYYKRALEEITFSKEYFEKCYAEPYVEHFYSKQDIEKFRKRWQKHVRNAEK